MASVSVRQKLIALGPFKVVPKISLFLAVFGEILQPPQLRKMLKIFDTPADLQY